MYITMLQLPSPSNSYLSRGSSCGTDGVATMMTSSVMKGNVPTTRFNCPVFLFLMSLTLVAPEATGSPLPLLFRSRIKTNRQSSDLAIAAPPRAHFAVSSVNRFGQKRTIQRNPRHKSKVKCPQMKYH